MFIIRLLAMAFLVIAAIAASFELFQMINSRSWHPIVAEKFWYSLHPESLDAIRHFLQREVDPGLWDWVIAPILRLPAWAVAGVPGLLLLSFNVWVNFNQTRKPKRAKFRATA